MLEILPCLRLQVQLCNAKPLPSAGTRAIQNAMNRRRALHSIAALSLTGCASIADSSPGWIDAHSHIIATVTGLIAGHRTHRHCDRPHRHRDRDIAISSPVCFAARMRTASPRIGCSEATPPLRGRGGGLQTGTLLPQPSCFCACGANAAMPG